MRNISNKDLSQQQVKFRDLKPKVKHSDIQGSAYAHYKTDDELHQAFNEGKLKAGDTFIWSDGRQYTITNVVYNGRNKEGAMYGGWSWH